MAVPRALFVEPRLWMDFRADDIALEASLGRYSYSHARPALAEHAHGRELEICYLVKGRQTYRVHGCNYHLRGGDVFMTFPREQHSTGGAPEEKGVLYWLTVRAPVRPARFLGLPRTAGEALWQALGRLPERHFPGSRKMKEILDALTLAFHGEDPLRVVAIRHLVTGFLLELAHCGAGTRPVRRRPLQAVLRHIAEHLDEPLSVAELARLARLSTPHFKARFKEETGVPPAEYQLRARIEEARRRLVASDRTITEIAFDLGFSSSQYFATVFKRFTGERPSARR